MKRKNSPLFTFFAIFIILSLSCQILPAGLLSGSENEVEAETASIEIEANESESASPSPTPKPTPTLVPVTVDATNATSEEPVLIIGKFEYTNDFYPEGYAYEHAVSLIDVTGFVLRDEEWEHPVESQVLGYVKMDFENDRGTFRILLPARPAGVMNDVDHDGKEDRGVQIFAVEYTPNWLGGPFYVGNDPYLGWPTYLASVTVDTENQDEITGGKLIIWAPDSEQDFPTGFGEDGLLFTEDDPVAPMEAGYSVIDLDQEPFAVIREAVVELTLYEPSDVAVKDFSDLSYTEAFDSMFEIASKEYSFNGVPGKAPDWDSLYAQIFSKVKEAEENHSAYDYYLALRDFTLAFKDGHVGIDGGDLAREYNSTHITGGYGFSIRELDDGRSLVVYVQSGGPADLVGMQVGAELISIDDIPIAEAIGLTPPFSTQSTDFGLRYEQTIFVLRGEVDIDKKFAFANPSAASQSVTLTSIWEMDSLFATYLGGEFDENVLPVEYRILPSWIGYIRMNSNSDDLNLAYRIFERALETFEENEVLGLILDLRLNFGGSPLSVAGWLSEKEITLGQLEYYSDLTGKFEPEGNPQYITPYTHIFKFDKMVLLVDQFCFSACEIEAYGLSQVPGMDVMGQFPTGGVEAETARGDFELPEGISLTVPTGRFTLPDGSIFLEGVGVVPTIDIAVDEENVLSEEDVVLQAAVDHILE